MSGDQAYLEAKKIFDWYDGSHFHMVREGDYQKYKEFGVPKEVEMRWISELKKDIVAKLYSEKNEAEIASLFSRYGHKVAQTTDKDGLLFMLEFAKENQKKWDSFTNLGAAKSILNTVNSFDEKYKRMAIIKSLELLKNIKKAAFRISDSYKEDGVFPDYATENKITERVDSSIKYYENELKSLSKRRYRLRCQ